MTSVASLFAPPTATPLAFYTPGLTGMDPARPAFSTAFQSLTTTVFKWMSLGSFSRRTPDLSATPTSEYHSEPTKTVIATTVNPAFVFFVSFLFGAGVVYFGRRVGSSISPFTVYRQKAKKAQSSQRALHTESPTLFHQSDNVLPLFSYTPRLSSFWIYALSFVLRGLAFLFRLIAMHKLLDVVEDNATNHEAAINTDRNIAESRVLDRRSVHAMDFTTPTQTGESPARLSDVNKTLVAFTPYAKPKLGQIFLPSSDDRVDVILSPLSLPTCIEIDPASSSTALGGVIPSLPASPRRSSYRNRQTHSPNTVVAALSVEPSGVPDTQLPTSSSVYKSFYRPLRAAGDRPSTTPRNNAAVSAETSDRAVALGPLAGTSAQPRIFKNCLGDSEATGAGVNQRNRFISPAVADLFRKIFPPDVVHANATSIAPFEGGDGLTTSLPTSTRHSSFRNRPTSYPNTVVAPLSVEPSGVPDIPLPTSSPVPYQPFSRQIHPTSGDRPSTPPRNNAAVSLSVEPSGVPDRVIALAPRAESSSQAYASKRCLEDSEVTDARVNRPNRFTQEEIDARLKATRERLTLGKLLTSRLSTGEINLRHNRFASTRSTGAEADRPSLKDQTQPWPSRVASKTTNVSETDPNLVESVAEVRERVRRTVERAREAADATDLRIRAKFPTRDSQQPLPRPKTKLATYSQTVDQETPRDKAREALTQIRQRHEYIYARVEATLKRCDDLRESRTKARSQEDDKVQTGPVSGRPVSTLFSKYPKYRSLTYAEGVGLDHRIQPNPDHITAEQSASSAESSCGLQDYIPEATDDESWSAEVDVASTQQRQAQNLPSTPSRSRLLPSRSSESNHTRLHSPVNKDDQPQKFYDLFYSPTFAPIPIEG